MDDGKWKTVNPSGKYRVLVTKNLPGKKWLDVLTAAGCKVDTLDSEEIQGEAEIREAIGNRCEGVIGQLTENWNRDLFRVLKEAGGRVYSNYAVGYNNVDVRAATEYGIAVGNTPGVLTRTTAELAVALTLAAARRIVEADYFTRQGKYTGWQPSLFLGMQLVGKTVGVIGAGRIGSAYARIMVEGFKMNLIYYDVTRNSTLEEWVLAYSDFLKSRGEDGVFCTRAGTVEEVLKEADVVSLHPVLDKTTYHLINDKRLGLMKESAILVNASRGPVIDERALASHLEKHPGFRAGLDVYENEPDILPALKALSNAVIVPHIGSATQWTRRGMAVLAACNVAAILQGYPVVRDARKITMFLEKNTPKAAPGIVNAEELNIPYVDLK